MSNRGGDNHSDEDSSESTEYTYGPPKTWKQAQAKMKELRKKELRSTSLTSSAPKEAQSNVRRKKEFEDPLQILTTTNPELRGHKVQEKLWSIASKQKISDWSAGRGDIDISKEDFNAALFFATVHDEVPFEVLMKQASKNLEQTVRVHQQDMRSFVKNNVEKYMAAKDAVDKLYNSEDAIFRSNALERLSSYYKDVQRKSKDLYGPMVQRKDQAEEMKTALAIMKKYQFILDLPGVIEENIRLGQIKKVVQEYNKAKYFSRRSIGKAPLFKPIFEKIEKMIENYRSELLLQLELSAMVGLSPSSRFTSPGALSPTMVNQESPQASTTAPFPVSIPKLAAPIIPISELLSLKLFTDKEESIIQYLYSLDSKHDPAQFYLTELATFIKKLIEECQASSDSTLAYDDERKKVKLYQTVKLSCKILEKNTPHFMNLANNILSGKYLSNNKKESKPKEAERKPNLLAAKLEGEIMGLFSDILATFEHKINVAIKKVDNERAHQQLLRHCVEEVMKCHQKIANMPNTPKKFIKRLDDFVRQLKQNIVNQTWKRTIKEISCIYIMENWQVIKEGISQRISQLPLEFEQHVLRTLYLLKPFINGPKDPLVIDAKNYFLDSISVFADCLYALGFSETAISSTLDYQEQQGLDYAGNGASSTESILKESDEQKEKQLLLLLSNCDYTRHLILPQLFHSFAECFMVQAVEEDSSFDYTEEEISRDTVETYAQKLESEQNTQNVVSLFEKLSTLFMDGIIRRKAQLITRYMQKGMELSGYDWLKSPTPTEVRSFILELLLQLALMHSRIETLTSSDYQNSNNSNSQENKYTKTIFSRLSERLAESFSYQVKELEKISTNAALQLDIEIEFARKALRMFETETTREIYQLVEEHIQNISSDYEPNSSYCSKLRSSILREVSERTRIQLSCFDISSTGIQVTTPRREAREAESVGLNYRLYRQTSFLKRSYSQDQD